MLHSTTATLACTPVVPQILADFGSTNQSYSTFLVSVWELGEGIGPFFIGPLSEHFGRRPLWHICNTLFTLFSIACALSTDANMLIAFRFLNGLVVACLTLGPTIISDMFPSEERGTALGAVMMMPMVGPAVGPIIGSTLAYRAGWRWAFWIIAIATGLFEIPSLIFLQETSKTKILERRAREERDAERDAVLDMKARALKPKFAFALLLRAFKLWIFYPTVFIIAIYLAMSYGYQYLVFTMLTEVLEGQYSISDELIGVCFLGIGKSEIWQCRLSLRNTGLGSVIGLLLGGKGSDWYIKKRKKMRGVSKPEDRLPPIIINTIVMVAGIFLYGWTAQGKIQWMAPIIGTALQGLGLAVILISTQAYLVDAFPTFAASASAAGSILRSLAGAVVPLAGPPLYKRLGLGWGNSLLAFTALVFLPIPLLLLKFGEQSRFRRGPAPKI